MIVPATLAHIRALLPRLRRRDVEGAVKKPRHLLNELYRGSVDCRAAIIDGQVMAVWGLFGSLVSSEAHPWIFAAAETERMPHTFYRLARVEIARMLETRTRLVAMCKDDYLHSVRFWSMLGFTVGEPVANGYRHIVKERHG